jgi:hypothetical protein
VERLQALQDMRQQESNRLEALSQGEQSRVIAMVKDHVEWLRAQISRIESEICDHIDNNPDLKRDADLIRSIPKALLAADQSWRRNSWPTWATYEDSRVPRL